MKNYSPRPNFPQPPKPYDAKRAATVFSYRINGLLLGVLVVYLFCYFYVGEYPAKYLVAGGVLGYFLGWVAGNFFYTKKD